MVLCLACGGTTTIEGSGCPPRAVRACTCSNGESGVRRCEDDSGSWTGCQCSDTESSGRAAGGECSEGTSGCLCDDAGACGPGLICADDHCSPVGSADPATSDEVPGCSESDWASSECLSVPAEIQRTNVLLVLDRSASMDDQPAGYATTKWDALRTELAQVLPEAQAVSRVGLELFPTTAREGDPIPSACGPVDRCCEMPGDADMNVPLGVGTATVPTILEALDASGPVGGTPTSAALARAVEYFSAGAGATLIGDRTVVLVTDGAPNCNLAVSCDATACLQNVEGLDGCTAAGINCCTNDPLACLDDAATLDQILALSSMGVRTTVVALPGTELYATSFAAFAAAGDAQAPSGSERYYAPASEEELRGVLISLLAPSTPPICTVLFPVEVPNPNEVRLAADCEIIPSGGVSTGGESTWWLNGPTADQPLSGTIVGPICYSIQYGDVERIDLVLDCGPIEMD